MLCTVGQCFEGTVGEKIVRKQREIGSLEQYFEPVTFPYCTRLS